jgi:hypothetical protein
MIKNTFFILFLSLIITLCSQSIAYSDEDFWDEPMQIDESAKTQEKTVTDSDFEKVMSFFEKKKKEKEKKKRPKGKPVWQNTNPEQEQDGISKVLTDIKQDYPTVMLPVTLLTPYETEIPPGYYRMLSAKSNGEYYINLYQGNSLVAKLLAKNTGNDYNQKSLNYAKIIPIDDNIMKIIYGDIDCNIETQLQIKQ